MAEMHVIIDSGAITSIGPSPSSVPLSLRLSGNAQNNNDDLFIIPAGKTWSGVIGLSAAQAAGAGSDAQVTLDIIGDGSFPGSDSPILATILAPGDQSTNTLQLVSLLGGSGGGTVELHGNATTMYAWGFGVIT